MSIKKLLWIGDGIKPTGFSTVNHNIIKHLPKDWEIHHLAVNYSGDPHEFSHKVYPAIVGGDIWGFNRIESFGQNKFDAVFILNDIWVITQYLELIKQTWKNIPPIVVYFPVDAEGFDADWFRHFDIVTVPIVYTEFGKRVCEEVAPEIDFRIISHGVDTETFKDMDKREAREILFKGHEELMDAFIFLNANRNQPRKRLDLALEGFKLFVENKDNVFYYHHAGLVDAGWNIPKLVKRLGIDEKFVTTNSENNLQKVPVEFLNIIYNAADVGLNTSTGEGFGLTSIEHVVTGAPQIVPDHSACRELFSDCGLLIPTTMNHTYPETLTIGKVVSPVDIAEQMEILYSNSDLYSILSKAGKDKFTDKKYSWKNVSNEFKKVFDELW